MHSDAATIGEIDHPVAGSTARGAVTIVGIGSWRQCYNFGVSGASPFRWEPLQMGEAAGIAAELDLVEQLSAANATFRPTAR